jgi:hypothetical protein
MFDTERTAVQEDRGRLLKNRAWLNANFAEVQQAYADKWVLVLDEAIAGVDVDVEVLKRASEGRRVEALLIRIPTGTITTPI